MVGVQHSDLHARHLRGAALVHAYDALYTFLLQPHAGFKYCYHAIRLCLSRNLESIANMVEVAVRDEHDVELGHLLEIVRAGRIAVYPRVNHQLLTARRLVEKSGVAVPGYLGASAYVCHVP